MGSPVVKFTKRQEKFLDLYMKYKNGERAVVAAGYSSKCPASSFQVVMQSKTIQEELKKRTEAITKKSEVSQLWVITKLKKVVETSMKTVDIYNHKGKFSGKRLIDANAANKALETLGKHLGMFVTKAEVKVEVEANINQRTEIVIIRSTEEQARLLEQMVQLGIGQPESSREVIEVEAVEVLDSQSNLEATPISIN